MNAQGDIVHALAAVAARARAGSLPPAALEKIRLHALDSVGAMFAGAQTAEGKASRAPFVRMASSASRPVDRLGPACTAAVLSASCRLTECDDIHLASCTTPGSVVYAAALAMTQITGVAPEAAAEAVAAGYDVMVALGVAADGADAVYGETWPTYLGAAMTSAAVAATLMKLSEERTAAALSIAATMTTGASGRIGQDPTSRWMTLGCAVQNGLTAAAGAEAGLHGDPRLLERLTHLFAPGRLLDHISSCSRPAIEQAALKPYCTGRQSLAATEAFVSLLSDEFINPQGIERIRVIVPRQYRAMIDRSGRPRTKLESRGIRYQLALAALHPDDLFDIDRQALRTNDPEVRRIMDLVEVEESSTFAQMYPRSWPGGVVVHVGSKRLERGIIHPKGDPERPLAWADIELKLQSIARHSGVVIPVGDLAAAARELNLAGLMALLSEQSELWHVSSDSGSAARPAGA